MSKWSDYDLSTKVEEVLDSVHGNDDAHHFGRPYVSAYQIAIGIQQRYPDTVEEIGKPVGGAGGGQQDSLAQYLSNELSKQIKARGADHPVEGAFFSNTSTNAITFTGVDGQPITSSLVGTGYDMALYRLR